MSAMINRA